MCVTIWDQGANIKKSQKVIPVESIVTEKERIILGLGKEKNPRLAAKRIKRGQSHRNGSEGGGASGEFQPANETGGHEALQETRNGNGRPNSLVEANARKKRKKWVKKRTERKSSKVYSS